jgi:hypothetical protein
MAMSVSIVSRLILSFWNPCWISWNYHMAGVYSEQSVASWLVNALSPKSTWLCTHQRQRSRVLLRFITCNIGSWKHTHSPASILLGNERFLLDSIITLAPRNASELGVENISHIIRADGGYSFYVHATCQIMTFCIRNSAQDVTRIYELAW